jgi:hypothetical protein
MPRVASTGKCRLCGQSFSKQAMTRHLSKCLNKHVADKPWIRKPQHWLHLVIEGGGPYWLHLEVRGSATLEELDGFLRDLWLECCGHLSAFRIEDKSYSIAPDDTGWADQEEEDMQVPVERVLRPGMHAEYEYDFGTTTKLQIKVVGERTGAALAKERVLLLARNEPPAIACGVCGAPATQVDTEQAWQGEGWLCDACAAKADSEMLLPVVNSPRTGVCGYTGSDLESV